jgi:hypothetical protein
MQMVSREDGHESLIQMGTSSFAMPIGKRQ